VHQHPANTQKTIDPVAGSLAGLPDGDNPCAGSTPVGLPIALKLTGGHAHDGRAACDMLGSLQTGDIMLPDGVLVFLLPLPKPRRAHPAAHQR